MFNSITEALLHFASRARFALDKDALNLSRKYICDYLNSLDCKTFDCYYSSFAIMSAQALRAQCSFDEMRAFLGKCDIASLDLPHAASLARSLRLLNVEASPKLIEKVRSFEPSNPYDIFLKLGALEDCKVDLMVGEYIKRLRGFKLEDASFSNLAGADLGGANPTAAAVVSELFLEGGADPDALEALKKFQEPIGGFKAHKAATAADLLSTASAVFALKLCRQNPKFGVSEFAASHWLCDGSFSATVLEQSGDCEYLFYGLLALGAESENPYENPAKKSSEKLLSLRSGDGAWTGELSSSAISTAVSAYALHLCDKKKYEAEIRGALKWLKDTALVDFSWGDTPESPANPSATILTLCALKPYSKLPEFKEVFEGGILKLKELCDFSSPLSFAKSVLKIYGRDLTFSAPILAMCASVNLGDFKGGLWRYVPRLPFELALLNSKVFGALNLPVVSYAIPALVCVGLVRAFKMGGLSKISARAFAGKLLKKIEAMQPSSGGFLEAVPLTAFCAICLSESGLEASGVFPRAINFILSMRRSDGSFPIDANLQNWLTSMSAWALADDLESGEREKLISTISSRNIRKPHPFTGAKAGGWAWISSDGGVPDADDTSAALCALHKLGAGAKLDCVKSGLTWLMNLQNSDGGIPTFCKGWNKLPFDRSCPDISAHAHKAMCLWVNSFEGAFKRRLEKSMLGIERYLKKSQTADGSWTSLWFGDQDCPGGVAPVLGTAIVLEHLGKWGSERDFCRKAAGFLISSRNADFAWGGARGVKSKHIITARVISALSNYKKFAETLDLSANALLNFKESESEAVGLYFAKLWYSEKLYSYIHRLSAFKSLKDAVER